MNFGTFLKILQLGHFSLVLQASLSERGNFAEMFLSSLQAYWSLVWKTLLDGRPKPHATKIWWKPRFLAKTAVLNRGFYQKLAFCLKTAVFAKTTFLSELSRRHQKTKDHLPKTVTPIFYTSLCCTEQHFDGLNAVSMVFNSLISPKDHCLNLWW